MIIFIMFFIHPKYKLKDLLRSRWPACGSLGGSFGQISAGTGWVGSGVGGQICFFFAGVVHHG